MAGRRKLTTSEQLEKLNETISAKEEELKELRIQRKELEAQKKQEDLSELYNIITASGKSVAGISHVEEYGYNPQVRYSSYSGANKAVAETAAAAMDMAVMPGEVSVEAQVSVEFVIE